MFVSVDIGNLDMIVIFWNLGGNLGLFGEGCIIFIISVEALGINVCPLKILLIARAQLLCCCRGVSWERVPVVAG
jgi:hypothetical protein